DEFADNGHMPYEIYIRETRRIMGRAIFTEQDARPADGLKRAPVHADSIGVTDWFLDSHPCTPRKIEGNEWEGELRLNNITTPGQVSWRCLLPEGFENFIVPVCLSSSHVGWGAIRLEPAWMSYGESAAHAIVLALRNEITPARLDADRLVRHLADHGILLSFFNDVRQNAHKPWYAAVQYLGTQGFFGSYDALPGEPLRQPLAEAWAKLAGAVSKKQPRDATADARDSWQAEQKGGEPITAAAFAQMLDSACDTDRFTK
ncbi:MAG: FAD-dependent oxidoreductase, partial [Planctomycetaceae bacterium]|nr:FAD-dependent oxidoreductase [Planctomycetaceae bacterium]